MSLHSWVLISLMALLTAVGSILVICITKGKSFSRSHVAVHFSPYVSVKDMGVDEYDSNGLMPMISKISSKFNKILVGDVQYGMGLSVKLIPSAVAMFNKKHEGTNFEPMEVFLSVDMLVLNTSASETHIATATQMIYEANKIYPGTVTRLILDVNILSDDVVEQIETYMNNNQRILNSTGCSLWAYLDIWDCGRWRHQLPRSLIQILPYFKALIFSTAPARNLLVGEPEVAASVVTRLFKICQQKVKKFDKKITVLLSTYWMYTNKTDLVTHNKKLVKYWETMNEWAIISNVSIIFDGAFDNPYGDLVVALSGWWRLVENASYHNSSQYIFEEKRSAVLLEHTLDRKPAWQIVVWITVVVVVVILVPTAFLWIRLKRVCNRFYVKLEAPVEIYEGTSENFNETQLKSIQKTLESSKRKRFELLASQFTIDKNFLLGRGKFGEVYEGSVKLTNESEEIRVAAKTTKLLSPATARAGLLSEALVLGYLGKHHNIVNLIGMYIEPVTDGEVFLFLERCELGSLETYLRKKITEPQVKFNMEPSNPDGGENRCMGLATANSSSKTAEDTTVVEYFDYPAPEYVNEKMISFTQLFLRWSHDIVNGMKFLARKKVVHADLATRNILLTFNKRAKISDFGLSRRLYDYEVYLKEQQEPLPWRWMAPESLRRLEFNEKTDVWSFGVTLWEIYSFGDLPFGGLSWTPNFSSQLTQGLRLPEPTFNDHGMYSHMLKCWNIDPLKRPTFSELKTILKYKM